MLNSKILFSPYLFKLTEISSPITAANFKFLIFFKFAISFIFFTAATGFAAPILVIIFIFFSTHIDNISLNLSSNKLLYPLSGFFSFSDCAIAIVLSAKHSNAI